MIRKNVKRHKGASFFITLTRFYVCALFPLTSVPSGLILLFVNYPLASTGFADYYPICTRDKDDKASQFSNVVDSKPTAQ
jgi:hypothetical protein